VGEKLVARPLAEVVPAVDAAQALTIIVSSLKEYALVREEEKTKRRAIEAREKIEIAKIKANEELLLTYMRHSFAERAEEFRRLFNSLDKAQETGDTETLGQVLQAVVALAKESPLGDLVVLSKVRDDLADPNHEWEL
jgi:hypothetical protein